MWKAQAPVGQELRGVPAEDGEAISMSLGGRGRRRKGAVGERDACEALRPALGPLRRVIGQARQGDEAPDIDGIACPFKIEVKNQKTLAIPAWWRQAKSIEDPRPPLLAFKLNGKWMALVECDDLAKLLAPMMQPTSELLN